MRLVSLLLDQAFTLISGIVDWGEVARHYGKVFEDHGGDIHLNFKVNQISENPHGGKAVQIRGDDFDQVQ